MIKSIRIRNGDIPPNSPEMTGDSNVLTQSPSESCHNDDIQWTVADVMEVMKDNAFDDLGMMVKSVRDHRGEYDLLIEQQERRCPKRISDNINHFVNEVLSKGTGSVFAKEDDKFISKFTLRDSEMQGTTDNYKDGSSVIVTDGMKIIGKNVPSEEKAWVSRYSQVVKTESCEVFDKVFDLIPATLFPEAGETVQSFTEKIGKTKNIDVRFNYYPNKSRTSLNVDTTSKQPIRRTTGLCTKLPHVFETDTPDEEDGDQETVATMYGYPNMSCPATLWTCFAMSKIECLQMLLIWRAVWPLLSGVSRRSPPNSCQQLNYTRVGERNMKMGGHRDNNDPKVIERLVNGQQDPKWRTVRGRARVRVKRGSSVVVFTRCNKPMTLTFMYASLDGSITQETKHYVTSPSYKMQLGDWTISVLDPIDDMLMLHSVDWADDVEASETDWRVAYVYRWLEEARDYYAEGGCRIRRTKVMMNMKEREVSGGEQLYDSAMFDPTNT